MNTSFVIFASVFSLSISTLASAAGPQGPVTETCSYGEGEAKTTVTIHKEQKKGAKKTVDVTHGSTFKKVGIPVIPTPVTPAPGKSYASYSENSLQMAYGPDIEGFIKFTSDSLTFETNKLNCKSQ